MKNQINEMHIRAQSKSINESFLRTAVATFACQLDPTVDELCDLKTAVSEAVTNCIIHAYKDSIGEIYIDAYIFEDRSITVRIRDKGCGIENIDKAMEPLYTTGGEERAGLGFAVMQNFTDNVKVFSTEGKGTTVILKKKFSQRVKNNG